MSTVGMHRSWWLALGVCACAVKAEPTPQPVSDSQPRAEQPAEGTTGAPECELDPLLTREHVARTYPGGAAPEPRGGVLPSKGTFELVEWSRYGAQPEDEPPTLTGKYRFLPNNTLDIVASGTLGRVTWRTEGTKLFISGYCPQSVAGVQTAFEYTYVDEELTLFSEEGVQRFKLTEPADAEGAEL